MAKKRTFDEKALCALAQSMLTLLPLAKKRLLGLDTIQRRHHLPNSHLQVLALLESEGTLSVSEISRRLGIAKPNITPLIDRLFDDKLVAREHNPADRRIVDITLLPAGTELLEQIKAEIAVQLGEQLSGLSVADSRELVSAVTSLSRILQTL